MPILVGLHRRQEKKTDADANRAIGDVEGWKTDFAAATLVDVETQKIDYMPNHNSIDQVSCDAAKNKPERGLSDKISSIEIISPPRRFASSIATADLPTAVGPQM